MLFFRAALASTALAAAAYAPPADASSTLMWRSSHAGCMEVVDTHGDGMCMADGSYVYFETTEVCD